MDFLNSEWPPAVPNIGSGAPGGRGGHNAIFHFNWSDIFGFELPVVGFKLLNCRFNI